MIAVCVRQAESWLPPGSSCWESGRQADGAVAAGGSQRAQTHAPATLSIVINNTHLLRVSASLILVLQVWGQCPPGSACRRRNLSGRHRHIWASLRGEQQGGRSTKHLELQLCSYCTAVTKKMSKARQYRVTADWLRVTVPAATPPASHPNPSLACRKPRLKSARKSK